MRAIALTVILVLAAHPAAADHIGFYDTPAPQVCVGPPPAPFTPTNYYVVHQYSPGALGSRWRFTVPSQLLLLGFNCGGVSIPGDPAVGVSVSYGACQVGSFVACTFSYLRVGVDPFVGCYHVRVLAYPGDTEVMATDCAAVDKVVTGGYFSFEMFPISCDDCAAPTDATTWGAVKALYR